MIRPNTLWFVKHAGNIHAQGRMFDARDGLLVLVLHRLPPSVMYDGKLRRHLCLIEGHTCAVNDLWLEKHKEVT